MLGLKLEPKNGNQLRAFSSHWASFDGHPFLGLGGTVVELTTRAEGPALGYNGGHGVDARIGV